MLAYPAGRGYKFYVKAIITTDTHFSDTPHTVTVLSAFAKELAKQIKANDCKVLINCGDWISNDQRQLEQVFKLFRDHISIPIVTVLGNHSWWVTGSDRFKVTVPQLIKFHATLFERFNIHYLEDSNFILDDVIFCGFDGWYCHYDPPSRDKSYMPPVVDGDPTHQWMQRRAMQSLGRVLDTDLSTYRKKVCVTHFTPPIGNSAWEEMSASPRLTNLISEKFDFFFVGHSHKEFDEMADNCRVINVGSDYNLPKFKVIEI